MNVARPTSADAERVAALIDGYGAAHGAPPDATADGLRDEWRDLDLERDAWLLELDGRLAGYACVYGRGQERLDTDGYVDPGCTGRGVGAQILRLAEARARERGAMRLHNATLHRDEAGRALFEANSYAFVRAFLRMAIGLTEPPPEPVVPDGLRLDAFDPADERALHASFGEFHRRGERTVALAVDATNPTGAVRLYERIGMHTLWRADVYEKRLA